MRTKRLWGMMGASYTKEEMKYSFDYGQFSQDWCVNRILDIDKGFFLDIGAGVSDHDAELVLISTMSNTYGLEKFRNWNGIAIDYDDVYIKEAKRLRSCSMICEDLMQTNINDILKNNNAPEEIDYLSLDVDDAQQKVFNELDFSSYKFKIITYEHNIFRSWDFLRGKTIHDDESRNRFKELGYGLLFGNVGLTDEEPVEDWYVDQNLFEKYGHIAKDGITRDQIMGALLSNNGSMVK